MHLQSSILLLFQDIIDVIDSECSGDFRDVCIALLKDHLDFDVETVEIMLGVTKFISVQAEEKFQVAQCTTMTCHFHALILQSKLHHLVCLIGMLTRTSERKLHRIIKEYERRKLK